MSASRQRIAELTRYFLAHGVSDVATAQHKAIEAIGAAVHRGSRDPGAVVDAGADPALGVEQRDVGDRHERADHAGDDGDGDR
jgi:hypothetical protein